MSRDPYWVEEEAEVLEQSWTGKGTGPDCDPDCRQGDHTSTCQWYDWMYGDNDNREEEPTDVPPEILHRRIPVGEAAPEGFCEVCGLPDGWHDDEDCFK